MSVGGRERDSDDKEGGRERESSRESASIKLAQLQLMGVSLTLISLNTFYHLHTSYSGTTLDLSGCTFAERMYPLVIKS